VLVNALVWDYATHAAPRIVNISFAPRNEMQVTMENGLAGV
jgi:hypothetical protein